MRMAVAVLARLGDIRDFLVQNLWNKEFVF
jgi:hypothetical protein